MRYKANETSALDKIYSATLSLMKKTSYDSISISDIIRESNISRSTFYVYFKKKDDILMNICDDVFNHIFDKHLSTEKHHDYSSNSSEDYIHKIEHSFCHFLEDKDDIIPILNSSGSKIFLNQLRKRLTPLIESLIKMKAMGDNDIPLELKLHQYINGYVSLLQYYLRHTNGISPKTITQYYFDLYK